MDEIILTTPEGLRKILKECLATQYPAPQHPKEQEPIKLLHSIQELASFLGCSNVTAFNLKKSGKIRYRQFGRKLIFNTEEILEDLNKRKH